jgi:hypothetical protein
LSQYGNLKLADSLTISGKVVKNNLSLTLPPFSIAILK